MAKSEQAVQKRQHQAASLLRGTGYYLRRIPPKLDESTVQVVLGTCPPGMCPLPRGIWTHGFHRPIRIYLTNQFTCGSACSGHGYVPDRNHHCEAPADKRFGAYWSQKVQLWWQQFLLIFLRTNVRVHGVTKKMQLRPIPRRAAPYEEFLSWGSRHDCPVEVGTYCIQHCSPAHSFIPRLKPSFTGANPSHRSFPFLLHD